MITALMYHTFTGPYRASRTIRRAFRPHRHCTVRNDHVVTYCAASCSCGRVWDDTTNLYVDVAEHLSGNIVHVDRLSNP